MTAPTVMIAFLLMLWGCNASPSKYDTSTESPIGLVVDNDVTIEAQQPTVEPPTTYGMSDSAAIDGFMDTLKYLSGGDPVTNRTPLTTSMSLTHCCIYIVLRVLH